jgi:hypothetical protein
MTFYAGFSTNWCKWQEVFPILYSCGLIIGRNSLECGAVDELPREPIMSHNSNESGYTPEEQEENSRVDAMAIFSIVIVAVALLIFYVAS